MKKIIVVCIIVLFTSGCANYREMSNLAIVSALGIEYKEDEFIVTAQIINISNNSSEFSSSETPVFLITGNGKTIFDAIRSMHKKSSKTLFFTHTKVIVLDKSILESKKNMASFIDLLSRDMEMSLSYKIVCAVDFSISDILSTLSLVENFSAIDLENTINTSVKSYGIGYITIAKDTISKYLSYGINDVYSVVDLTSDRKDKSNTSILEEANAETYTTINKSVSFNKERKMTILNQQNNTTLNLIHNNFDNIPYVLKCDDNLFAIETQSVDLKLKDFKKGKIYIVGNITFSISEYTCDYDLDKEESFEKIKNILNKKLEKDIEKLILFSQQEENDFIGIGRFIYKNNPKYFDFKNNDWDTTGLKDIKYDIKINSNIIKQGNLKGDVENEK